jgi:hypothetical protein
MTDVLTRPVRPRDTPPPGPQRADARGWWVVVGVVVLFAAVLAGLLLRPGSGGAPSEPSSVPTGEAPDGGAGNTQDLQPVVRRAVERAIAAAAADGVELRVTSGWRSAAHQQELYDAAIEKYGSPAKARRWVLPPDESEHVKGGAVDVGPTTGATWLEENGERFGLCRRYDNEPWHFERLAGAVGSTCPPREPHA